MTYSTVYSSSKDQRYLTELEKINKVIDELYKKVQIERRYVKVGNSYNLWIVKKK